MNGFASFGENWAISHGQESNFVKPGFISRLSGLSAPSWVEFFKKVKEKGIFCEYLWNWMCLVVNILNVVHKPLGQDSVTMIAASCPDSDWPRQTMSVRISKSICPICKTAHADEGNRVQGLKCIPLKIILAWWFRHQAIDPFCVTPDLLDEVKLAMELG